jgi:N-acyl-D-amino-acid deacylase
MLREGMAADLVVFDDAAVSDPATFDEPHQYAVGFSFVIVNGEVVLDSGRMTGARPGAALRHASPESAQNF